MVKNITCLVSKMCTKMRPKCLYYLLNLPKLFEKRFLMFSAQLTTLLPCYKLNAKFKFEHYR